MLDSELEQAGAEAIEEAKRPLPSAEAGPVSVSVAGHQLTVFVETWPLIEAMVQDIRRRPQAYRAGDVHFPRRCGGTGHRRGAAPARRGRRAGPRTLRRHRQQRYLRRVLPGFGGGRRRSTPSIRIWEALWKFSFLRILNRRNHRKLLVIDDTVAYFGGMNLVDTSSAAAPRQGVAGLGRLARRSRPADRPATVRGGRELRALVAHGPRRTDRAAAAFLPARSTLSRRGEHSVLR